ncbi:MAG: DUF805 domain-containing protein [Aliishimia sp.]
MGPVQAITNGLFKFPIFTGRASRSEFWWFAPIAIAPPLYVANEIAWTKFEFYGIWRVGLLILAALPLLSAGSRRLQDVGENGAQIMLPFTPFVLLWVTYQALYWFSLGTLIFGLGIIIGLAALLLLIPAYLFAFFVSFITIGPIIGQLILPSDVGSNPYGPNPNEVPT